MSRPDFVHLHVHSEYSLLDGANRVSDLVEASAADGQRALALTDHGNMFGAIDLVQTCAKAGVKPIVGCEVYVARRSRKLPHHKLENPYNHLTLLARDSTGYQNLLGLASIAYTEGLAFRPRVDREVLARHSRGLIALSGCLSGEVNQLFAQDRERDAERAAAELADMFGRDGFWLELQRNGIDVQDKVNESLVRLSQRTGLKLVATNDIHYLRQEDCATQDVLLCINTGAKKADQKRFRMDTETLYFRSREEMGAIFRDLPGALAATVDVAEQVDLAIEFDRLRLPVFDSPDGRAPDELFDSLCEQGFASAYGAPGVAPPAARERLEYEKGVIRQMGFVSYFLIVWDLVRWARENGVPVGPGRGSAAGSIVAYVLGITRVDPLRYDLLFERFLNPSRISMPDIDIDFCKEGREKMLEYTRARYGSDHVAQIVTFGTMASRTAVRDVGRVLDLPLSEVNRIAALIPAGPQAPSLAEALAKDKDLAALRGGRPDLAELFQTSVKLEGLKRHISTHAAGVVIADRPLSEYVPLATHDGEVVTQWEMSHLEKLGLLKMDYLGLRTLTILERALRSLERRSGARPDLERLALDDAATYRMLAAGDTLGVFQLESEGMRKLLARLAPDRFEDLIAVLALYRPGPLESGMAEMFIRRKHGREPISFPHPSLEATLADTYGCIVYQEQVMRISNVLSGFSLAEADNLRKAMGKKQPEIMAKFEGKFVQGAVANGCAKGVAKETWEQIVKFGGYGFNKSHSTAYALITYWTAWLKANHRREFLAANMSCEMHDSEKIKAFVEDARRSSIAVLPPSMAASVWEFEPERDGIRFGLGAIKGTGEKAVAALLAARARGVDALSIHALATAADAPELTRLTWEALTKAGAFDGPSTDRGALMAELDVALADGARAAADRRAGQASLFGDPGDPAAPSPARAGAAARGPAWTRAEVLRAEKEALGFYLSGHPLEERAGLMALLSTVDSRGAAARPGGSEVQIAGMIGGCRESITKKGRSAGLKMARFQLEDLDGAVGAVCFAERYERFRGLIQDDNVAVVKGKLEERGDEPGRQATVLVDEVLSVDQALARFEGQAFVELGPGDDAKLEPLRKLLEVHRGPVATVLLTTGADGAERRVRLRDGVRVSERLAAAVDELLGKGRFKLGSY